MAGYIPAANYYDMIGGIGDALTSGVKQYQQKQLLSDLGNDLAQGNYDSAAQKALRAGDMGTGLKLVELGRQAKTDAALKGYLGGGTIASLGQPPASGGGNGAVAPESLLPLYKQAEAATGVPAAVLMAQHRQESAFNPNATGKAGEIGLGQILPSTARDPGYGLSPVDPEALRDPATNIMFSAKYLAARAKAAGQKDWSDPTKGLLAYNGGGDPDYVAHVSRYMPQGGGSAAPVRVAQAQAGAGGGGIPDVPLPVIQQMLQSPQYKAIGEFYLKRYSEANPVTKSRSITDPTERARMGIPDEDKRVWQVDSAGKLSPLSEPAAATEAAKAGQPKVIARGGAIWKDGKVVYENKNEAGGARSAIGMFMRKFIDENPGAGSEEISRAVQKFQSQQGALTKFTSGKQGDTIRSFNVLVHHLGTFGEVADALGNGDLKAVNRLSQRYAEETGKPAPTDFDAVKSLVGDEIVKAVVGGAGALGDREEVKHALDRANSPAQLRSVINRYRQLAGGQLEGLRFQYKRATGLDDFEESLMPSTRGFLDTGGDAHGKPAAGVGVRSAPAKAGTTSSGIKWSVE